MSAVIDQNLFRHCESTSGAFNNLCTIIHRLDEEGVYRGQVVHGEHLLGMFRLKYDKAIETSQVNVDLSLFDALFRSKARDCEPAREFLVGREGYVVFHASGHHDGLHVTLTRLDENKKPAPRFDSRKLTKGDLVALRPWHPGTYRITSEPGGQTATLTVRTAEAGKYHDPAKLEAVRVALSQHGFEPAEVEQWPLQALVISVDTSATLALRPVELAKAT